MKAVSLFSGIGGIDIGLSAAGFDVIAQVEIDEYCQQVLTKHSRNWWPNSVIYDDVREFGADSINGQRIDILTGGFPCQPFSHAGKRLAEDDNRNMWPATRRIISEIRPRALLLENVKGLITQNKGEPGYLGTVLADLSEMGYVCGYGIISAADAGASHRRERVWIVAYSKNAGHDRRVSAQTDVPEASNRRECGRVQRNVRSKSMGYATANGRNRSRNHRRERRILPNKNGRMAQGKRQRRRREYGATPSSASAKLDARRTAQSVRKSKRLLDGSPYGIPSWLDTPEFPAPQGLHQYEWEPPRTVDKSQQYRRQRIQAIGNAVVPQIVYYIAKEIYKTLEPKP